MGTARLRVISATPAAGTVLPWDSLTTGMPIAIVVEHVVNRLPPGVTPILMLMARIEAPSKPYGDGQWMVLSQRAASRETMQLAVTGTLLARHVLDDRITLRIAVMFRDSAGSIRTQTDGSTTLIEFPVARRGP